jgi:4a-hydroxytetrahydrobiopterin dehydratase
MSRARLSASELETAMTQLPAWELREGQLHRELRFASFIEAFGFMTQVALIAQAMDHHPAWLNVYDRLVIDLWTHDAGGLTVLDIKLAREIDELLARRPRAAQH